MLHLSMKKQIANLYGILEQMQEFDFIDRHCDITIINFCNDYSYLLFGNKTDQVLLKLNAKQVKVLKDKLNDKTEKDQQNEELHNRFMAYVDVLKKINLSLKELMEKQVKLINLETGVKQEEIVKVKKKMMDLWERKAEVQKSLTAYIDFFIEDSYLWQF